MFSILMSILNMTCETKFEEDFISMKVKKDKRGNLVIETQTRKKLPSFTIGNAEIIRRRFSQPDGFLVVVEVEDGGEWIPNEELFGT